VTVEGDLRNPALASTAAAMFQTLLGAVRALCAGGAGLGSGCSEGCVLIEVPTNAI
jgi:hypothetical protein